VSYQDVADMAEDWNLRMRLIAAAAQEHPDNPVTFIDEQIWRICGQPGWGDAWQYARLTHTDVEGYAIGKDETVVTDGMILSGMQSIINGVAERAAAAAAVAAAAAAEQADVEHTRQVALFAAQRDVELANPIVPTEVPTEPVVDPAPLPPTVDDPNAPPPATGPFDDPAYTPPEVPPEEPVEEPTP
jgi:hypothetical protein